jgi:hypothetical protein
MNNPLSGIEPDKSTMKFLGQSPGPIGPPMTQIRIIPEVGGPFLLVQDNHAVLVDHNNNIITLIKKGLGM